MRESYNMRTDWFGNTVICTAVTGGYDYAFGQPHLPGVDYIFFTDGNSPNPIPSPWKIEILPECDSHLDNRRRSKRPKLNPHSIPILNNYKYVIWIDGEMQILNPNFVQEIMSYMDNGFVASLHPDAAVPNGRYCAYGEATIRPPKYAKEPLDAQCDFYRSEGFPENYGLYACGLSARDMTNEKVKQIGELWHEQNLTWSYQDQVSFPYCLWKYDFQPDILPRTLYDMGWLCLNLHKKED
jgi:hypothetical protein